MSVAKTTIGTTSNAITIANNNTQILQFYLHNQDNSSHTVDIYFVANGDSIDTTNYTNRIYKGKSIASGDTLTIDNEVWLFNASDKIYVIVDNNPAGGSTTAVVCSYIYKVLTF